MFLVAVVILCVVLTAVNLVLTLGVIKRLRDHSDQLVHLSDPRPGPESMLGPGARPAAFTAVTLDAEHLTEADVPRGGLVGFFSPTCDSCEEWLPRFVEAAKALPGGRDQAIAVVVAESEAAAPDMVATLRQASRVVVEPQSGPLTAAFKVNGFPAMFRMDDDGAVVTYVPGRALGLPVAA